MAGDLLHGLQNSTQLVAGSREAPVLRWQAYHASVIVSALDPVRQAILLVAGDKAGNWKGWYEQQISIADKRYEEDLKELKGQQ